MQSELDSKYAGKPVHFVGVAIPGTTAPEIDAFKKSYGISFDVWIDVDSNFKKLVPPGGADFPITVVIDKLGLVRYLAADYSGEAAFAEVDKALKAP